MKVMSEAFDLCVRLNQINKQGHKNENDPLLEAAKIVLKPLGVPGGRIVQQLIRRFSIDLRCKVAVPMEVRRTRWTTRRNLQIWFDC